MYDSSRSGAAHVRRRAPGPHRCLCLLPPPARKEEDSKTLARVGECCGGAAAPARRDTEFQRHPQDPRSFAREERRGNGWERRADQHGEGADVWDGGEGDGVQG